MNGTDPDTTRFIRVPRRQQRGPLLLMAVFLLALANSAPGGAQPYSGGRYNDDHRNERLSLQRHLGLRPPRRLGGSRLSC